MSFGPFVFGLGVSPLAVVQETIIVRFFKSSGLGFSMSIGLVAGLRLSSHLIHLVGTFWKSCSLLCLSFPHGAICLVSGAGAQVEATEMVSEASYGSYSLSEAEALEKLAAKKRVNL